MIAHTRVVILMGKCKENCRMSTRHYNQTKWQNRSWMNLRKNNLNILVSHLDQLSSIKSKRSTFSCIWKNYQVNHANNQDFMPHGSRIMEQNKNTNIQNSHQKHVFFIEGDYIALNDNPSKLRWLIYTIYVSACTGQTKQKETHVNINGIAMTNHSKHPNHL